MKLYKLAKVFMLYNKNEELVFIGTKKEMAKFLDKSYESVLSRIRTELSRCNKKGTIPKIYGYTIVPYEGDIIDKGE